MRSPCLNNSTIEKYLFWYHFSQYFFQKLKINKKRPTYIKMLSSKVNKYRWCGVTKIWPILFLEELRLKTFQHLCNYINKKFCNKKWLKRNATKFCQYGDIQRVTIKKRNNNHKQGSKVEWHLQKEREKLNFSVLWMIA